MSASRFVWHQLLSPDPVAAAAFYTALFSWTAESFDLGTAGFYHQFSLNGESFGGVMSATASEARSQWISFISVADVDAAARKAKRLGGTLLSPPLDIPTIGRYAVIRDPLGAHFTLFRRLRSAPPLAEPGGETPPGGILRKQLTAVDLERASTFYGALFAWGQIAAPAPASGRRLMMRGAAVEAEITLPPPELSVTGWWLHFRVSDIEPTLARCEELGGGLLTSIVANADGGRTAFVADPLGANFALTAPE